MDYKQAAEILERHISELRLAVNELGRTKSVSALNLDLIMDKARQFYDVLLIIRKAGEEDMAQKNRQPAPTGNLPETTTTKAAGDPEPSHETNISATIISPEVQASIQQEQPVVSEKMQKAIMADKLKGTAPMLYDNIARAKSFTDLSSKIHSKPIADIAGAIGLNDKFAFIHELFRGDTKKYTETLTRVNDALDFNSAYNYLTENFDWNMDSDLVQKLLELIRRKFILGKNG